MKIPTIKEIAGLFKKTPAKAQERGYREVAAYGGGINADWNFDLSGEDSSVWQNAWALTSRVRDLFRTNSLYIKYRELLWAQVFGKEGHILRSQIKETEDRVVNTPDEEKALIRWEDRVNRVRKWAATRDGKDFTQYRAFKLAEEMERQSSDSVIRGKAVVQAGNPDVYANALVQNAWQEWGKGKNCDARGQRSYHTLRQLRLISAVRDGDVFIRKIRSPKIKPFGFTLQLINAEWCDRFYNDILANGNVVRMGIEYQMNDWGIGKMVGFYFIKRQPMDWQFSTPGVYSFARGTVHERIDADEIIHYARAVDADATRPAPWVASTIPKARQLDQYELAEVVAAREAACKTGFFYSDVVPEGGVSEMPDPRTGVPNEQMGPGDKRGLPWGVKWQGNDPLHPNGNFPDFRQGMIRSIAAGMPGGDYSRIGNDYAAINFSAGRLQSLDTNETYRNLQRFDIDVAEEPIFEDWLEMALITGAINLPLAKLAKFNKPFFQAREFRGIDEVKEEQASAMRIANKKSSRQRECADDGEDWSEVILELAEEEMILDELGMSKLTTADSTAQLTPQAMQQTEDNADEDENAKKPAAKKPKTSPGNGKHVRV